MENCWPAIWSVVNLALICTLDQKFIWQMLAIVCVAKFCLLLLKQFVHSGFWFHCNCKYYCNHCGLMSIDFKTNRFHLWWSNDMIHTHKHFTCAKLKFQTNMCCIQFNRITFKIKLHSKIGRWLILWFLFKNSPQKSKCSAFNSRITIFVSNMKLSLDESCVN